jgi:amino acid adenylation domain-containing protein
MLGRTLTLAAERWPDAVAVLEGTQETTFSALADRSGRIAAWLVQAGVGTGDRVALFLDRSTDAIAAIYGVLLAGAAYVPLDPVAPVPRNAVILRDSGAQIVLTAGRWGRRLKPLLHQVQPRALLVVGAPTRCWPDPGLASLETTWEVNLARATRPIRGTPEDLAVLLYTSGSTGTPKGVALSHRAVQAFADWAAETFHVAPGDRVSGVSPLHFDLSTFEIFGAVTGGATAVIAPAGASAFPATLAEFWQEQQLTVWYSVPGVLVRLLEADLGARDFSTLRVILFAGEVFPITALAKLMTRLPGVRFANLYGPTETNVCTWYEVPGPPTQELPIGTSASGAELRVENGELLVAGPSLLSGYHGDPERTAAAFVEREGKRFYRTGDRVRWGDDGQLRFQGRTDTMLKIQGFRIQPEEVEAALATHELVAEVIVVPFVDESGDEAGGKRLEARVVVAGPGLETAALLAHCGRLLPQYMVPTRVVLVSALARTERGKLVR